jgi:hypothetical protein
MICLFGVCIPFNLVIPFLLGLLHRVGFVEPVVEWARRIVAKARRPRGAEGDARAAGGVDDAPSSSPPVIRRRRGGHVAAGSGSL